MLLATKAGLTNGEGEGPSQGAAPSGCHLMPIVRSRGFTKLVIDKLLMLAGAFPDAEVHAFTAGLARAQGHGVVAAS